MDGFVHPPRSLRVLFDEDFDARDAPPEPEVIEPTFSAAELARAREAAWHEGHASGVEAASANADAEICRALRMITQALGDVREVAAALTEGAAAAIACLLMDNLAAAFPALCARHGDAEAAAIIAAVLPALAAEPAITVHANPQTLRLLTKAIQRLDPDTADRVHTADSDAMPPGDVHVTWHNGSATRDAAALWQQVADILTPAGLLGAPVAIRETESVE